MVIGSGARRDKCTRLTGPDNVIRRGGKKGKARGGGAQPPKVSVTRLMDSAPRNALLRRERRFRGELSLRLSLSLYLCGFFPGRTKFKVRRGGLGLGRFIHSCEKCTRVVAPGRPAGRAAYNLQRARFKPVLTPRAYYVCTCIGDRARLDSVFRRPRDGIETSHA